MSSDASQSLAERKSREIPPDSLIDHLSDLLPKVTEVPFGLFVDIDGTISEIVSVPDDATVLPGCRRALQALVGKLAVVAVVTGRSVGSARRMVGVDGIIYVGNHGLERWQQGRLSVEPQAEQYRVRIAETAHELRRSLTLPGVFVEEKGVGMSVHYRDAEDWENAHSTILFAVQELGMDGWMEVQPGMACVNLRLPLGVDKGTAVQDIARAHSLRGAIVLGDDITDLDAFRAVSRLAQEGDFLGVSVGVVGEETPEEVRREATYRLAGVKQVEEFLGKLADFLVGPPFRVG